MGGRGLALSVRIAGDGDVTVLVTLRRGWNQENFGGPTDDPDFNAAFIS